MDFIQSHSDVRYMCIDWKDSARVGIPRPWSAADLRDILKLFSRSMELGHPFNQAAMHAVAREP